VDTIVDCRLRELRSYVGIKESTGNNDGPEVEKFLRSTKLSKGYPWCGSVQHYAYRKCGLTLKPEAMHARASYWHTEDRIIWQWPDDVNIIERGDHGAIWSRSLKRVSHTFAIDSIDHEKGIVWTLEGNTNAEGSRDGNVFAKRRRSLKALHSVSRIP
jgi:hypothetical protein